MAPIRHLSNNKPRWEGYTLEELKSQRTIVEARIVLARYRVESGFHNLHHNLTHTSPNLGKSAIGRMLSALTYLDWAILAIGLFRKLSPIFRHR